VRDDRKAALRRRGLAREFFAAEVSERGLSFGWHGVGVNQTMRTHNAADDINRTHPRTNTRHGRPAVFNLLRRLPAHRFRVVRWIVSEDRLVANVFLSYSRKDHYFAELAEIKLSEAGIKLWRDQGQLRPGGDWRFGIESGIATSIAVIVALSEHSADSSYVTFEWAYGLGKGKTVVPLRLENCNVHPRLEPIQYLDFSVPGSLPWSALIDRIREIEAETTSKEDLTASANAEGPAPRDATVNAILAYLDQRGYQMMSYERIRQRIDPQLTDEALDALVSANPKVFRHAVLRGGKRGIAKLIP